MYAAGSSEGISKIQKVRHRDVSERGNPHRHHLRHVKSHTGTYSQCIKNLQLYSVTCYCWISSKTGPGHLSKKKYIYRVSQEERTKFRESVSYVKLYRYNPKHLYPKLNGYGDNGK